MRDLDRSIKSEKRRHGAPDKFDRPRPFTNRDGRHYSMPLGVHGNGDLEFSSPMTNEDIALLDTRYLDRYQGSLGGLPDDYVQRLFEHEMSLLRDQGFISPYRHVKGRHKRDKLAFNSWLRSHPDQVRLEEIMARDPSRRYAMIAYNMICSSV